MQLGDELRELRQKQDLSQEGLAYKAGISPREVRRIESGRVTPRSSTLEKLAVALGESADFFVGVDWEWERALDLRTDSQFVASGITVIA